MPVLNINEDEKTILVTALTHERVRLMKEWTKRAEDYDSSAFSRDADCSEIDAHADDVTDLRRKIEAANYAPKTVWHHDHGWLTKSFFESDRGKAAYKSALQAVRDNVTGSGLTPDEARDQMSPGTWTTLPEGFDVDAWPYEENEETDPEDKIVIASADTQRDGTMLGFYRYSLTPPEKRLDVVITINGKTEMLSGNATEIEGVIKELTSAAVS